MWRPRPATWQWLLAHEARLLWRMSGGGRLAILIVFGGLLLAAAHVAGWALMRHFDLEAVLQKGPGFVVLLTAFVMLLVLSAAFGLAVSVLFGRGDMDLLLSSPVPIRNVYAVRGISVGLASVAMAALFWLPFANMAAVFGHWGALASYPVLVAMGLLCSALAFAGTLALVRWLGPRRARVAAQVAGAIAGAFLVIAMQFGNLLPKSRQVAIAAWLASEEGRAWFGAHSVLTWPVRALFGDPFPTIAMLTLGVGAFALVVRLTTERFASAVQEGPVAATPRRRAARRRFREGLARIVIAKELLLIARDPTLIAKSLVQLLYLVPMIVILFRRADLYAVLAGSVVVMASSLAGTFAWITVSGEEAPDLVAASPVSSEHVRWLKVGAALVPSGVALVPFLAWYASRSLGDFAIFALFAAAGLISAAVIHVWTGKPGQPRDLAARRKQNVAMNFIEAFGGFGWGAACFCAMTGRYALMPVGVVLGLAAPVAAWLSRRWLDRD